VGLINMRGPEPITSRVVLVSLIVVIGICCLAVDQARIYCANAPSAGQASNTRSQDASFDPLLSLSSAFRKSINLKNGGHLLEFCPDGTCDGFVSSAEMSVNTLKDIAYLYEYFFSDYTFLDEWRAQQDSKNTADRVLSKAEYQHCKGGSDRETARCVLLTFSRNGRVRLIFVRYDEGHRGEIRGDLTKQLSEDAPGAK